MKTPDDQPDFVTYTDDTAHFRRYENHQGQYRNNPRESDKILHRLIDESLASAVTPTRILDAGCSNGNLLFHLQQKFAGKDVELSGFDYSDDAVDHCQNDPGLQGIPIFKSDIRAIPHSEFYDVIVVNAVYYCLADSEFEEAIASVSNALRPGGQMIVFDLITDFPEYSITVVERSPAFRHGHTLHIRNREEYEACSARNRLRTQSYFPFDIPIRLPRTVHQNWLSTYTMDTVENTRLMFRGCLYQPWSFFVAERI